MRVPPLASTPPCMVQYARIMSASSCVMTSSNSITRDFGLLTLPVSRMLPFSSQNHAVVFAVLFSSFLMVAVTVMVSPMIGSSGSVVISVIVRFGSVIFITLERLLFSSSCSSISFSGSTTTVTLCSSLRWFISGSAFHIAVTCSVLFALKYTLSPARMLSSM